MRIYTGDKQGKWIKWLHLAEYWYNTTHHMLAGMSPFKELYGYDSPSILDIILRESKCPAAQDTIHEMQEIIRNLKDNLTVAINRMKQQTNKKRIEKSFEEGDMVFVRLQPYKQTTLKNKLGDHVVP